MKRVSFNFFILLFSLLFTTCKKVDVIPPSIRIISPTASSVWEIGTHIPFQVEITDDKEVAYAKITLYNEDSWAVGSTLSYSLSGTEYLLNDQFPLTGSKLKNGTHTLTVTAGDGHNEVYSSVTVKLTGEIVEKTELFVITESSSSVNIYAMDSNTQFHLRKTLTGDFLDARCDQEERALFVAPRSNGKLTALNMNGAVVDWEVSIQSSISANWFQGIELIGNELYVGNYGGETNVYNYSGSTTNVIFGTTGYMQQNFLSCDQRIFIHSSPRNAGLKDKITAYNWLTTLLVENYARERVQSMFRQDAQSLLLFSNTSSGFTISSFHWQYGNENVLKTVSGEQINEVIAIDANVFLVATEQSIYRYNGIQNNLTKIINTGATCLFFETESRRLILGQDQNIYFYGYDNLEFITTVSVPNKVVKILYL
ncbi:MAG: hypothetical protein LBV02_04960 [Bacteroidales bacterium]|jgi:hypothetical protein|nr:hypothetical protein [Bacteroidales bacterium]